MYTNACVFFATVFGESPEGATWVPDGVSAEDAAAAQRVAAAVVLGHGSAWRPSW
jgi:hypothetical protein